MTRGFGVYAGCYLLLLAAAATPSPLYATYQREWGLSTSTITLIFGVYAVTLLSTLMLIGDVSDRWGRRRTVLGGLALLGLSSLLFATASGTLWLLAARATQGLATGLAIGTLSAALVDEAAPNETGRRRAATANAALPSLGLVTGGLAAGLLIATVPAMPSGVFVVQVAATVALGIAVLKLPEPTGPGRIGTAAVVPGRMVVRVPTGARDAFGRSVPTVIAIWTSVGVLLALTGPLLEYRFGVRDHVLTAVIIAASSAAAAVASISLRRRHAQLTMPLGGAAIGAGSIVVVLGAATGSLSLVVLGHVVTGFGVGSGDAGVMRDLTAAASEGHERAGVFATVNAVGYLSLSVPVAVVGQVAGHGGLTRTAVVAGVVVVVIATWAVARSLSASRRAPIPEPPNLCAGDET